MRSGGVRVGVGAGGDGGMRITSDASGRKERLEIKQRDEISKCVKYMTNMRLRDEGGE